METRKFIQLKPPPPKDLDAVSLGYWVRWCKMTNLEIMRETAMKGTTHQLAARYLSQRNEWDIIDATRWLDAEISGWAMDLLLRNQIYKAMQIYSTSGKEPYDELKYIFFDTKNKSLREYLATHLIKNDKLDGENLKLWQLFKAIDDQNYFINNNIVPNVNYIKEQSEDWKFSMGTKIFFDTYNIDVADYVHPEKAWVLLLKENPQFVDYWINIQYHRKVPIRFCEYDHGILEKLNKVFLKLTITDNMMDMLPRVNIPKDTQEIILNELGRFGIFNTVERQNLLAVLRHIVRVNNTERLQEILVQECSNLKWGDFTKLLVVYCIENNIHPVIHEFIEKLSFRELDEKVLYTKVMSSADVLCKSLNCEVALRDNIYQISKYLSQTNVKDFFNDNPIILMGMLLLTNISIYDVLSGQCNFQTSEYLPSEIIKEVLQKFNNLLLIFEKINGNYFRCSLTPLNLLELHGNVKIKELYLHRFSNNEKLHFNNKELSKEYGYKKEISYTFFIKCLRPCHAYKLFTLTQSQTDLNQFYITSCDKVERLALKNILSREVVASCIVFIEMLSGKSYPLRIYLSVSEIIYKSKLIDKNQINDLFQDTNMNSEEIFTLLQSAILKNTKKIYAEMTGEDFTIILKQFDILVKFSSLHNLKLPNILLKLFAEQDLWLEFLIFIQIYNYPLQYILKAINFFKSLSISEHFEHCFKNEIEDDENVTKTEKNMKRYFFSKIGVRSSDSQSSFSDISSLSSYGSMPNSLESDILESDVLNDTTNLLLLFIRCHNSIDPPTAFQFACRYYRRPLLAVFATCYEPGSLITNWMTWLEVSCKIDIRHHDSSAIEPQIVLDCFRSILIEGYFKTLWQSFYIFFNENPLRYFLEFINESIIFNFKDNMTKQRMDQFTRKLSEVRTNSYVADVGSDIHFLNHKEWIQNTALYLISLTLQYGFRTFHDKILFLRFLCNQRIEKYFCIPCPNFKTTLKILEHMFTNSCHLTFDLSVLHDKKKFKKEINNYLDKLIRKNEFKVAINIAEMSSLPVQDIIIKKAQHEFDKKRELYWLEIDDIFKKTNLSPILAVSYLCELSEKTRGLEKYGILEVAHAWCRTHKLNSIYDVEKLLWMSYLEMENCLKYLPLPDDEHLIFYSSYIKKIEQIPCEPFVLGEIETANLKKTVNALLFNGDMKRLLRLEKIFGLSNVDLDILKLCLMLAEGLVDSEDLSFDQRLLLIKRNGIGFGHIKRTKAFTSSAVYEDLSTSDIKNTPDHTSYQELIPSNETLTTLETLTDNLQHGKLIGTRILRSYRSGIYIDSHYMDIVSCKKPLVILREFISGDSRNKLQVIEDFVYIFNLSKPQIADLVYGELVDAMLSYINSTFNTYFLFNINMTTSFHIILKALLMEHCSLLGTKLYSLANAIHQNQLLAQMQNIETRDLLLLVELLIKAHDCFTTDCNMEGISSVLKKSQVVINNLVTLKRFKLIVKLFTGIKRYSEMNYVFPILKDSGYFEVLLKKGSCDDLPFKRALLDYLKRYCPENIELYTLAALHFKMYSEIADLWEQECSVLIKRLIQIARMDTIHNNTNQEGDGLLYFVNCEDTKQILKRIMKKYHHAAEYHQNSSKVAKAMKASYQAQLVALQISLFKDLELEAPCMCIFKLTRVQINTLLLDDFSFYQALILTKAYNQKPDWASILFEQYVLRNKSDYLHNFLSTFELTNNLVHDLSRKFLIAQNPSEGMAENMKNILKNFNSIHMKYKVASELNFTGIIEHLLEGSELCYLKDTVWKSGYRK